MVGEGDGETLICKPPLDGERGGKGREGSYGGRWQITAMSCLKNSTEMKLAKGESINRVSKKKTSRGCFPSPLSRFPWEFF